MGKNNMKNINQKIQSNSKISVGMKKYIITTIAILLGVLLSSSALASTNIFFSPSSVDVISGKTFNLTVYANPNEVKNYTVSLKLKYPADLVEVTGFTQDQAWMPLTQNSYNMIDNSNGSLIKTAGYTKGFNTPVVFGTISFTAKKVGTGIIQVENGTLALNASSQNVFSGDSKVVINSTAAIKPVVNIVENNEDVDTNIGQEATALGALLASSTASTSENFNLTASVFGAGATKYLSYIGGIIVILGLIAWFIIFLIDRKKKK